MKLRNLEAIWGAEIFDPVSFDYQEGHPVNDSSHVVPSLTP